MSKDRAVLFDLTGTLIEPLVEEPGRGFAAAREIPGAVTCLSAVRAAGAKIAVVANVSESEAEAFRRSCPSLVALVDAWHLSYEAGAAKPSATIFHAAFAALEVEPVQALMIGDDLEEDVAPALGLGMSAVWLRREPAEPPSVGTPSVVSVDPHRGSSAMASDRVPEGALVAASLSDVRRTALTWMWARRSVGVSLTARLTLERPSA